jgi:hypothetical protein
MFGLDYTARHRSLLRAVAQGRAQLTSCGHAELCVDGLWCDQMAVSELVRDGLVRPALPATVGTLVPAMLTAAGAAVLAGFGPSARAV